MSIILITFYLCKHEVKIENVLINNTCSEYLFIYSMLFYMNQFNRNFSVCLSKISHESNRMNEEKKTGYIYIIYLSIMIFNLCVFLVGTKLSLKQNTLA